MPRGARLDQPGTLHHVMVRGIEGNRIVEDDDDRQFFVSRMGRVSAETGTRIFAWALLTNHAHILLKSGSSGLPHFMSKLLSGYASGYNRRHKRHGHLFQNRYKSIVCEEEPYFLKLVSYIHLNPLRAGLVRSVEELEDYPWSGHAVLLNRIHREFQDRSAVLAFFGTRSSQARKAYVDFVVSESGLGYQPKLTGGGLVRSMGGWSEVKSSRKRGEKQFSDERILGSGDFVRELLDEIEQKENGRLPAMSFRREAEERLERACIASGTSVQMLQRGCRMKVCIELRRELAVEYVCELGMTFAATAVLLGISAAGVRQILMRRAGQLT
jgi:REP element-mobilizing transposase RayT